MKSDFFVILNLESPIKNGQKNHSSTTISIIFFLNKVVIPHRFKFSFFFRDLVVVLVRSVVVVILVQLVVVLSRYDILFYGVTFS